MSPLAVVLMVAGILVGVAAINLAIWIPILRKLRRMPAALRAELEAAGETIVLGPEPAIYSGATAIYSRVKGNGVVALTDKRLAFRKAIGASLDIPVDQIQGVREDRVFLRSRAGGRRHVIAVLREGVEVGFFVRANESWLGALRGVAEASPSAR